MGGSPAYEVCYSPDIDEPIQEEVEHCYPANQQCECHLETHENCWTTETTTCCVTVPKESEECFMRPEEVCKTVSVPTEVPVMKEVCEDVCEEKVETVCREEPFQECSPIEMEVEKEVTKEVCE